MTRPETGEMLELLEPVLSAHAMRDADAYTIDEYGIPSFTLMEVAGRSAVDAAERRLGPLAGRRIVLFCGKGNNGGDGFVMARVLLTRGACVRVVTLSGADEMSDDAAHNYRLLERLRGYAPPDALSLIRLENDRVPPELERADLYVDALLGTGLTQGLRDPIASIVRWLNVQEAPVLAVDVPTGLHGDTGSVLGGAVRATFTVTMGATKTGLLLDAGPSHAGAVEVAEIGIPRHALLARSEESSCAYRTTDRMVRALLPMRSGPAHKYSVGMALVVGGSPGLTGAPVMASTAAARVGAGAVVCACHEDVQPILASMMTETMTLALPGDEGGELRPLEAQEILEDRVSQARALLVGCGLGRTAGTQEFIRELCASTSLPVVVDADGLNAFAGATDLLSRHAGGRWILTPHAGEFGRLAPDASLANRVDAVRTHASQWNCVLVLKGMPSLVGTPDGRVYICSTGNAALATAGTGDVLAGLIVGLLAQGLSPEQAAICGVHIGGACADAYVQSRSGRSMLALDLLDALPSLLFARFDQYSGRDR